MVEYEYFKYGVNKSMKKSSFQRLSPYLLISHNQRYYIMGFSSYWGKMAFHRLDHIKNIRVSDRDIVPIEEVEGYENGIRYRDLATSLPYMFVDDVIEVTFETDENTIDQVIDWFGKDISIVQKDEKVLENSDHNYNDLSDKLMLMGIDINSDGIYKIEKGTRILKDFELSVICIALEIQETDLFNEFRKEVLKDA